MAKKKPPPFVIRDRNTKPSGVLKAQAMRGSSSNTHTTSVTKYKNSLCKASKKLRIDSQMFSCAGEICFWRCGFCELATTSKPDRSNEQTRTSNALALPCSKSTQKGVTENALVVGPTLHPKGFCVLRDIRCWKTWKMTLKVKVAFGGVDSVSHPPRQPDSSNEQTGASNALALPCPEGSKSTQKGVTKNALVVGPTLHSKGFCVLRDIRCCKTWKKTLKVDKRQVSLMEEEVAKACEKPLLMDVVKQLIAKGSETSGQEADKLDGGGGSKSGGSLASGTLGLEWKRYKLLCVIGRWRHWSTRCDGVGRGVVRR
ncbi:hypothetical protein F2Q70_00010957 [Brassica cretica]|uniref:Uncharacterized protein n=1 Tax=Brassica cretica TaxID=69181 RepID=A0A8S9LY86_BRACR|nr:hypothetical protein F2Q70_00010957 [Brassica cretica]